MKILKFLSVFCLILISSIVVYGYTWEGFEKENLWKAMITDGNTVGSAKIVSDKKTEGKRALAVQIGNTPAGKTGCLTREGDFNLSKIREIKVDIYIEKPVKISFGLSAGESSQWYETKEFKLKRGWNKNLKVNLKKKNWKSAVDNFKAYKRKPLGLNKTKKMVFLFNDTKKSMVYIDNIRFSGKKVKNNAYKLPYDPIKKEKIYNDYSLLDTLNPEDWAMKYSTGVVKEDEKIVLKYKDINNINKSAYKVQMDMDWSEYSKLIIKAYNDGNDYCSIAMGLSTGDEWFWCESPVFLLNPEQTKDIVFLLDADYYKTELSKWKNVVKIENKNNVKAVTFLIYGLSGKKSRGRLKIENLQFLKTIKNK